MFVQVFGNQSLSKLTMQDISIDQAKYRISGKLSQGIVTGDPNTKRQAKSLFLFRDDFVRQKTTQGLLKEPA